MTNHAMTPGPWVAAPNVDKGNSWELCCGVDGRKSLPPTYANARAIAAVPALIDALQGAKRAMFRVGCDPTGTAVSDIVAALKSAGVQA